MLVEQVGVVLQMAADAVRLVGEVDGEVREGLVRAGVQGGGLDAGQVEAERFGALELGEGLENRCPVDRPGRGELAHHRLEGDPRVVVCVEGDRAHALQQRGERGVSGEVEAQREGVHEEAEQVLGPLGTVRDRSADDDVRLSGDPVQHRRVSGEQGHEQGAATGAAQLAQTTGEFRVEGVEDRPAVGGHRGGARPVGRQCQDGQLAAEGAAPVGQILLHLGAVRGCRQFPGVVGVAPGEDREVRGGGLAFGPVEGGQVTGEDGGGGRVDDDVVQGQHEDVLRLGEPDQPGDEQRAVRQVEPACALGREDVLERAVHDLEVGLSGCPHDLPGLPSGFEEDGTQPLVTGDESAQCPVQSGYVEWAVEADGLDLVVGGTSRKEPLQEPDPFLAGRQRRAAGGGGSRFPVAVPQGVQVRQPPAQSILRDAEVHEGDDLVGAGRGHRVHHRPHAVRRADQGALVAVAAVGAAEHRIQVVLAQVGQVDAVPETVGDAAEHGQGRAHIAGQRFVSLGPRGVVVLREVGV